MQEILHAIRMNKKKRIQTSLSAPMRGTTLESLLMWLTKSFGTGELKNTYALVERGDQKHYEKNDKLNFIKKKKKKKFSEKYKREKGSNYILPV